MTIRASLVPSFPTLQTASQESWRAVAGRGVVIASPGGAAGQGGMASVTLVIAEELRRVAPGMPVTILDPRGRGAAWQWPAFMAAGVAHLLWQRATGRADLLHLQVSERSSFVRKGLLAALGRALGMRVVLHHHGAELIPFFRAAPGPLRRWTARVARRADVNIVLGERWRTFLADEVGVAPERVLVLPNAVADRPARAANRGAGPFHLLLLAHLSPRKGVGELLAALQRLRQQGLAPRLTLAGRGDLARYEAEARALGVADLCRFTGWVDRAQVDALLAEADALVLPSFEEGLPMAILEALSSFVPVVATPVGSIGEVLTDQVDCLLVPPGDIEALAGALARLVQDPALRDRLAQAGHALFQRRFTTRAFMDGLRAAYAQAGQRRA